MSRKERIKIQTPLLWNGGTAFVRLLSGRPLVGVVQEYTLNGIQLLTGDGALYIELWEVDSLHCS